MRMISLPSGETVPVLGQGTWRMGEQKGARAAEVAALRTGMELGMTLIDTAEMYGEGGAEEVVAEAIEGRRNEIFLVSKVYPHNASRQGVVDACERSLRRLQTDCIDLYLLHWPGAIPLEETLEAFVRLIEAGKIRYHGVSNFDKAGMEELHSLADGRAAATDQVLYNLTRRGVEWDLLPWCRDRNIPVMAYSPLEQGRRMKAPALNKIAARHEVAPMQVALAWVLHQPRVIAIPKAVGLDHVKANRAALDISLTGEDLAVLDRDFRPPDSPTALQML